MKTSLLLLFFVILSVSLSALSLSLSVLGVAQEPVVAPPSEPEQEAPKVEDLDLSDTAKVVISLVAMLLGLMLFGGLFKNGTLAVTGVLLVSIIFTLIGWLPMWVSFVLCLVLIVLVVWNKA